MWETARWVAAAKAKTLQVSVFAAWRPKRLLLRKGNRFPCVLKMDATKTERKRGVMRDAKTHKKTSKSKVTKKLVENEKTRTYKDTRSHESAAQVIFLRPVSMDAAEVLLAPRHCCLTITRVRTMKTVTASVEPCRTGCDL